MLRHLYKVLVVDNDNNDISYPLEDNGNDTTEH